MSDTWYREPFALPPWQDAFGGAWNFDGTPANDKATINEMEVAETAAYLAQYPPELADAIVEAEFMLTLAETFSDKMREAMRRHGEPRGILGLSDLD